MRFLSLDPGLAMFGWCVWAVGESNNPHQTKVIECGAWRTDRDRKPKARKKDKYGRPYKHPERHSKVQQDARRCGEIALALRAKIEEHGATEIVAESLSYPRQVCGMLANAMSWSVLATVCATLPLPLHDIRPQRVREELGFPPGEAGKQAALERARAHVETLPRWAQQHAADAICVGMAYRAITRKEASPGCPGDGPVGG